MPADPVIPHRQHGRADGGDPLRRGGELRDPPRGVRPLPPRSERREAAYRPLRQADRARGRALADRRRRASAGRRGGGRTLLPRRPPPRGQGGLDRGHRRRPRGRVRDDRRPAGRLRGGRRDAGDLLLRGPQGLRVGVQEGRRPQRGARTRGQPQHRRPRQGVLRVARRPRAHSPRHALEVQGACLHPARTLAADLLRGRDRPRGRRDRARLRPERRRDPPRRRVRGHRGRDHRGGRGRVRRDHVRGLRAPTPGALRRARSGDRSPGLDPDRGAAGGRDEAPRHGLVLADASSSTAGSSTAASPPSPRAEPSAPRGPRIPAAGPERRRFRTRTRSSFPPAGGPKSRVPRERGHPARADVGGDLRPFAGWKPVLPGGP